MLTYDAGHPKAIAWSHEFLLALCAANYRDRARCEDDVLYTCFPMFHVRFPRPPPPHLAGRVGESSPSFDALPVCRLVASAPYVSKSSSWQHSRGCKPDADSISLTSVQSFPFFLGSGASFVCLDTWRSAISADTVLRHLRALERKHRKVDASLPPSILEDIADSNDPEWFVSFCAYTPPLTSDSVRS